MRRTSLTMSHPSSSVCHPNPLYRSCGCGATLTPLALCTIARPLYESMALVETLETIGEVTTHLSVMGMTTVKGA